MVFGELGRRSGAGGRVWFADDAGAGLGTAFGGAIRRHPVDLHAEQSEARSDAGKISRNEPEKQGREGIHPDGGGVTYQQ